MIVFFALQLLFFFQLKVLKCIKPLTSKDIVLGQYIGNPNGEGDAKYGYTDDKTVPAGSRTPTFAVAVVNICNERWDGMYHPHF